MVSSHGRRYTDRRKAHLGAVFVASLSSLCADPIASHMGGLWIFGNGNNGSAVWQPDPDNQRGTWTILSTCIITLSLCVYTALHLNIPAHRTGRAAVFAIKFKYVVFGLLAPELIVFNAWRQRTVAASLVAQLRKQRGGRRPEAPLLQRVCAKIRRWCSEAFAAAKTKRWRHITALTLREKEALPLDAAKDRWTKISLVHGFYILMGGYVLDVSGDGNDDKLHIWPTGVDRLTLSPKSVLASLASSDAELRCVVPFLSADEIWDRSKANGLAKAIVCIQALWFCAQVVGRLAQGMPISLLELNTLAHALCALLVYLLWWDKPLDVQEPTAIDAGSSEAARNLCALGWSGVQAPVVHLRPVDSNPSTPLSGLLGRGWRAIGASRKGDVGDGALIENGSGPTSPQSRSLHCRRLRAEIVGIDKPRFLERSIPEFEGLTSEERKSRVWVSRYPPIFVASGGDRIPSTTAVVSAAWESIEVDEPLLRRLQTMDRLRSSSADAWAEYSRAFRPVLEIDDKDLRMLKPRELNFTDSLMRHAFEDDSPGVSRNLVAMSGIVLSGILYGGLHMTAWGSATFRTYAEEVLWIVSCCVVALGGLCTFLGIWVLEAVAAVASGQRRSVAVHGIDVTTALVWVSAPLGVALALLYFLGRVYLLVEVFRNLAFLDPQVYQTPDVRPPS